MRGKTRESECEKSAGTFCSSCRAALKLHVEGSAAGQHWQEQRCFARPIASCAGVGSGRRSQQSAQQLQAVQIGQLGKAATVQPWAIWIVREQAEQEIASCRCRQRERKNQWTMQPWQLSKCMANKQFKPCRRQREKHRVTKVHINSKQCQNRAAGLSSAKGTAQQQRRQLREAHSKWRTAKACTKIDLHSVPAAAVAACCCPTGSPVCCCCCLRSLRFLSFCLAQPVRFPVHSFFSLCGLSSCACCQSDKKNF